MMRWRVFHDVHRARGTWSLGGHAFATRMGVRSFECGVALHVGPFSLLLMAQRLPEAHDAR